MAVNLLVYQVYAKDSMWAARVAAEPMNDVKFLLPPNCFYDSEIGEGWKKCILDYPANIRMPTKGKIIVCMQFESNVDAGYGYNQMSEVASKSIKYGKKFTCKNPDPTAELTRKDFDHDTWEAYEALDEKIVWTIGNKSNKFVTEIESVKMPPIECQKNYENCELYIYKPSKITFHMDKHSADLIEKMHNEGKGFINIEMLRAGQMNVEQSTQSAQSAQSTQQMTLEQPYYDDLPGQDKK